jgi:hypothetical protein
VDSRKGHCVDQQVEAVGAVEDEEEAEEEAATTLSYQFSNASAVRRKKSKHIEQADNRDPEIKKHTDRGMTTNHTT